MNIWYRHSIICRNQRRFDVIEVKLFPNKITCPVWVTLSGNSFEYFRTVKVTTGTFVRDNLLEDSSRRKILLFAIFIKCYNTVP